MGSASGAADGEEDFGVAGKTGGLGAAVLVRGGGADGVDE